MLERDVAPGIHRVEDAFTNWYLVEDGADVLIVDCGLPASWRQLPAHLAAIGRTPADVGAVVVTHAHPDHIGFAERIRTEWDVPVWLHERDRSLSRHPFRYETEHSVLRHRNRHVLRVALAMARHGALRTQPIVDVRAFGSEDGELDVPGRPLAVPTPGHTHGHTAFHFPDRGAVVVGDALATLEPYTGSRGPQLVFRSGQRGRRHRDGVPPGDRGDGRAHGSGRPRPPVDRRSAGGRRSCPRARSGIG